ncbi:MAG: transposase, partial [Bacteroidota bacterium]
MLDLSADSLIPSTTYTTAIGLARIFGNDFSHDKVTRFLNKEALDNKKLWTFIQPFVCSVECEDSMLIVDDTIFE